MRILGVNTYNLNNQNKHDYGKSKPMYYSLLPQNYIGTDSFESNIYFGINPINSHKEFRALCKDHEIRCIYCKRPMIHGGKLIEMLEKGVFSGPVKEFVEATLPYRNYLKQGQRTVFDQIMRYAKTSPQTHLSEIIQYLHHNSIKKLVKTQAKIFQSLIEESEQLPPEIKQKEFRKFMKKQHKRLYGIKYHEDFNAENFAYKINKLIQSIPNEELKQYISKITTPLSDNVFGNPNNIIPIELAQQITKSKLGKLHTAKEYSEYVIYRVQKIGDRLNRKDIVNLCETSKKMLNGEKVVINFSNKEFLKELVELLRPVSKTPIYYSMINLAQRLPSSDISMNSFIVKHRYSDSNTIGYKLLSPSRATIEHEKPRTAGGIDDLTNCVLACQSDNAERGSIPQHIYLKKWNKKNPQGYFNDVIKIANEEHLISPSDIQGQAKTLLEEGHIKVNLSKLINEGANEN